MPSDWLRNWNAVLTQDRQANLCAGKLAERLDEVP
jgi:hypothetical protein